MPSSAGAASALRRDVSARRMGFDPLQAVVGAGAAGLAAAAQLRSEGHSVVVFEQGPQAGGVWLYQTGTDDDPLGTAEGSSGARVHTSMYRQASSGHSQAQQVQVPAATMRGGVTALCILAGPSSSPDPDSTQGPAHQPATRAHGVPGAAPHTGSHGQPQQRPAALLLPPRGVCPMAR
jgi:glycine/D-amino acid oxidase-like deaminating enzyme